MRRRRVYVVLALVGALVFGIAAYAFWRPGAFHTPARLADPAGAKAAGDDLLASQGKTFLVFVAHPDDAEWWAGGTLGMLSQHNAVILVLGTSGDAGNGGLQSDLGQIREALQERAAKVLGYTDVVFLRHPDGHLAEAKQYPGEVGDIIARYAPDGIVTFDTEKEGPVYHHVDHEAAGRTALAAARETGGRTLYFIHTSAPDVLVDFAPMAAKKTEALMIVWGYHDTGPFGWFGRLTAGLTRRAGDSISRSPFPEVGVDYGELMRRETTPGAPGGPGA